MNKNVHNWNLFVKFFGVDAEDERKDVIFSKIKISEKFAVIKCR